MTEIQVLDCNNNIVSKFVKNENNTWTQEFHGSKIMYNETIIDKNNIHLHDNQAKALLLLTFDPCEMYLYVDAGKRSKMFPDCTLKLIEDDNNREIMKLLESRLALGKTRYGHGVRINDDTRTWGTSTDSWETMMMEEALDGMIYAAASILRIKRRRNEQV